MAKKVRLPKVTCLRCSWTWVPRVERPKWCPKCNSPYWNKSRERESMPKAKPQVREEDGVEETQSSEEQRVAEGG